MQSRLTTDSAEATEFERRRAGIGCPLCEARDEAGIVATLTSGDVVLQDDGDFPGYCILVCGRHVPELHQLSADERRAWIEDIAAVERAITAVCKPDKINLAMLGNLVPHLHCHVIPRSPSDPYWGAAPFAPDRKPPPLSAPTFDTLKAQLQAAFAAP